VFLLFCEEMGFSPVIMGPLWLSPTKSTPPTSQTNKLHVACEPANRSIWRIRNVNLLIDVGGPLASRPLPANPRVPVRPFDSPPSIDRSSPSASMLVVGCAHVPPAAAQYSALHAGGTQHPRQRGRTLLSPQREGVALSSLWWSIVKKHIFDGIWWNVSS
jgi:hypothetical protein